MLCLALSEPGTDSSRTPSLRSRFELAAELQKHRASTTDSLGCGWTLRSDLALPQANICAIERRQGTAVLPKDQIGISQRLLWESAAEMLDLWRRRGAPFCLGLDRAAPPMPWRRRSVSRPLPVQEPYARLAGTRQPKMILENERHDASAGP